MIWLNPLLAYYKVVASNHFALPVLVYLMWTQVWPIAELQRLNRESLKIIVENGGNHPSASGDLIYLSRRLGGQGLNSIESEYKITKIKSARGCMLMQIQLWSWSEGLKRKRKGLDDAP